MVRLPAQDRGQASVMEPVQEQAVLEWERARRHWALALISALSFTLVAQ